MIAKDLKKLLDSHKIKYVTVTHSPAYTTQSVSHAVHLPDDKMIKSVIVKLDGTLVMAVVHGSKKVDLELLKKVTKAKKADIATENEFKNAFPDCEVGAMPPFGNLYKMKMYVDDSLAKDQEIGFNAGTHSELIKMNFKDYEKLTTPAHGHFST